jgi:hypothetical protein
MVTTERTALVLHARRVDLGFEAPAVTPASAEAGWFVELEVVIVNRADGYADDLKPHGCGQLSEGPARPGRRRPKPCPNPQNAPIAPSNLESGLPATDLRPGKTNV